MGVSDFSDSRSPGQHRASDRTAPAVQTTNGQDDAALSEVWKQVYAELHVLAQAYMTREPRRITLQPTALVHEAFVKLSGQPQLEWSDRAHFFRIAASAMRQILVDHARHRAAGRHGGGRLRIPLTPEIPGETDEIDVLSLEESLNALAELDERKARVVEMRFFAGLTGKQIADVLGISPKTVETDWYFSRAWLRRRLEEQADDER